jgi:uncharacterized peroxidase-related enzyme
VAHAEYLRQEGGDDLEVERIKSDWRQMDLTEAERVMLEWVEKLTVAPSTCVEEDIEAMRAVGWTDRDVLDIAQVCAYFNMRVRIVDGLGLEVDDWQIVRAKAGSKNAAKLASERGVEMPSDPWGVR